MKLYYSKGACSLAVRITLVEIGVPCEYESVDLGAKKTEQGADFLKINPKGAVPVLVLDNQLVLTENAAIQQYLADANKAHQLLPAVGEIDRYRVLEWLNFVSTDLHKGCSPLFNSAVPQELKEQLFIPALKSKLTLAEKQLSQNKYLVGDKFTLPDGYLFVILSWMPKLKVDMSGMPNLIRYQNELKNRPAIQEALEAEGLIK